MSIFGLIFWVSRWIKGMFPKKQTIMPGFEAVQAIEEDRSPRDKQSAKQQAFAKKRKQIEDEARYAEAFRALNFPGLLASNFTRHNISAADPRREIARIQAFMSEKLRARGQEKIVIGVSGGIDSTVMLHLATSLVGPHNVLAYWVSDCGL